MPFFTEIWKAASFPYNELHHTSPFSKLIDWEPMIDKLQNRSDLGKSSIGGKTKYGRM